MPPLFATTQKLEEKELLDILASKAPQAHKAIMIDHGFDPQTATIQEFIEISERAETKEALENKRKPKYYDSASDESRNKKSSRSSKSRKRHETKYAAPRERKEFFCKEHGANSTHNSRDCKVLNNPGDRDQKPNWKKPDHHKKDYKDHRAKYKNKIRDMNVMHREAKAEKDKWKKANKTLQAKLTNAPEAKDSSSDAGNKMPPLCGRRKSDTDSDDSSSSSSSSSSDDHDSSE